MPKQRKVYKEACYSLSAVRPHLPPCECTVGVAAFADTTVLRYIFGVEPDLLFSKSSGTVAAPAPAAQSTLSEPLKPPAAMPPPPAAGDPVPVRAASTEEEEVKPPILGFPEKFELALRYGEGRMAQDIEMSDSDRLCFDALAKQADPHPSEHGPRPEPGPGSRPVPSRGPSPDTPGPMPGPDLILALILALALALTLAQR